MIFVDANFVLRYLVQPTTPETQRMSETARALFRAVERGEEITTSEVVLHEVAYILASNWPPKRTITGRWERSRRRWRRSSACRESGCRGDRSGATRGRWSCGTPIPAWG